jgi:hypothetical protein
VDVDGCHSCRSRLPRDASFCPGCGTAVAPAATAPSFARVTPRLFGVLTPLATVVLGLLVLSLSLAAFVLGRWILGAVMLAVALLALWLFVEAARRLRLDDPLAGAALAATRTVRGWAVYTRTATEAWSRASCEAVKVQRDLGRLRREKERLQLALGDAAYRRDDREVERLRLAMDAVEKRAAECRRSLELALAAARERLAKERPTLVVPGGHSG